MPEAVPMFGSLSWLSQSRKFNDASKKNRRITQLADPARVKFL